ncbi:branched-chain amino acid ABC transporter permease [Hyperthermus butylicus]|uniref:branched-chain amino acid ABC transporter permease n=1 Tax=Hyperthermus butylicus TaxID=54248 RepID=UPI00064FF395|nr:branched-chain amino acid ABC transporter permease [Hyperthermus butylicus]
MELSFIVYSLAWGSALALMAGGLAIYYSVSRIANFAHGEFASIGVITYLLLVAALHSFANCKGYDIVYCASLSPDNLWMLALVFAAGGLVSLATFVAVFWPLSRRGATPLQLMVASIGVMMVIRFLLYIVAGLFQWLSLPSPGAAEYVVAGFRIDLAELLSIVLAVAALVLIALFTSKTMLGISLRAVADNPTLAEAAGINSFRVQAIAWFIGGGLAALGGVLMFILTGPPGERPIVELGWMNLLSIFAAAVLGGLGSFYGTLAASILLGLAYNEAAAWISSSLGLDSSLALSVPFALTLLVLLFFPEGLAGIDWYRLIRLVWRIGRR